MGDLYSGSPGRVAALPLGRRVHVPHLNPTQVNGPSVGQTTKRYVYAFLCIKYLFWTQLSPAVAACLQDALKKVVGGGEEALLVHLKFCRLKLGNLEIRRKFGVVIRKCCWRSLARWRQGLCERGASCCCRGTEQQQFGYSIK